MSFLALEILDTGSSGENFMVANYLNHREPPAGCFLMVQPCLNPTDVYACPAAGSEGPPFLSLMHLSVCCM